MAVPRRNKILVMGCALVRSLTCCFGSTQLDYAITAQGTARTKGIARIEERTLRRGKAVASYQGGEAVETGARNGRNLRTRLCSTPGDSLRLDLQAPSQLQLQPIHLAIICFMIVAAQVQEAVQNQLCNLTIK